MNIHKRKDNLKLLAICYGFIYGLFVLDLSGKQWHVLPYKQWFIFFNLLFSDKGVRSRQNQLL